MKTTTLAWIAGILLILVGGWYVWMQSALPAPQQAAITSTTSPDTSSSTSDQSTSSPNTIQNNLTLGTDATSTLGTYLIGYNGMTLYAYSKDSTGTSTCYDKCSETWPPYIVPNGMQLNIQSGVTGAKAGTITRADGTVQVTYNGKPLYFYNGDVSSGDVTGESVGNLWRVVKP
ncbi:MAG: hypothetical protein P4L81_03070 [Candidatus Pacebacteria bacterium]|nr:hypothetical protein [Candidatus Paceibacterota bacterium]